MKRGRAALTVTAVLTAGALAFGLGLTATRDQPRTLAASGDARKGREAIAEYGCGSCHTIPGVRGADAQVGPPLTGWAQRSYIAGSLSNTPANLTRWVAKPQTIEPGTAMPDMGVPPSKARDIAAYLFGLR